MGGRCGVGLASGCCDAKRFCSGARAVGMRTKPPVRRGRNKSEDPRQARCDDRRNSGCGISEVASDDRAFPEKSAAEVAQQIARTIRGFGGTKNPASPFEATEPRKSGEAGYLPRQLQRTDCRSCGLGSLNPTRKLLQPMRSPLFGSKRCSAAGSAASRTVSPGFTPALPMAKTQSCWLASLT